MKKKIVVSAQGGPRKKKRITQGTVKLLDIIFKEHGGVVQVAKLIGVHKQQVINWRTAGAVPLKHLGHLSLVLNVSKYALNFEGTTQWERATVDWEELVSETIDDPTIAASVLSLPAPKVSL